MDISLTKANLEDAAILYAMQLESFMPLLERYQDFDTNPAAESLEKVIARINQPFTDYYIVKNSATPVGGIRIVKMKNQRYRVSPIFILPEYQRNGIAQKVFRIIEEIYYDANMWELETILQERANCYLYEKLGYKTTGKTIIINAKMTLISYEKQLCK